jgi:glycosyltransferase involved in cell wall biosynthesis
LIVEIRLLQIAPSVMIEASLIRLTGAARMASIAILDDVFPWPVSGFRWEEYVVYLDKMSEVSVYSSGIRPPGRYVIDDIIADHVARYPDHEGRIHRLRPDQFPQADAYYLLFLDNTYEYLEAIERTGKPFAFTLYPGGGFGTENAESQRMLDRIFSSPSFRRVLVTMPNTRDFVLERYPHLRDRVVYFFGGLVSRYAFDAPPPRNIDGVALNVGFIGNGSARGINKGYDLFIEAAHALARSDLDATFQIVGPWTPNNIPLEDYLAARTTFHGFLQPEALREVGRTLDVVLSPNRPGILLPGAFDGFPTGSCVVAGLQGATMFCTDILALNRPFKDGHDLVLVEPNVDDIVSKLSIVKDRAALAQIGKNGRKRLIEVFSNDTQMPPRLAMLRDLLPRPHAGPAV